MPALRFPPLRPSATRNVPGQNRRGQVAQAFLPATDGRPCPAVIPEMEPELVALSVGCLAQNRRRARTPVGCRQECLHYVFHLFGHSRAGVDGTLTDANSAPLPPN